MLKNCLKIFFWKKILYLSFLNYFFWFWKTGAFYCDGRVFFSRNWWMNRLKVFVILRNDTFLFYTCYFRIVNKYFLNTFGVSRALLKDRTGKKMHRCIRSKVFWQHRKKYSILFKLSASFPIYLRIYIKNGQYYILFFIKKMIIGYSSTNW